MKQTCLAMTTLAVAMILSGCDFDDPRAVQLATDSADRQAEQNQVVADLGREMSENQTRIMEAVESSRKQFVELQRDVAVQRQQLDVERREIASQRRFESLLVAVLEPAGWIVLAALPLALCWLVLRGDRRDEPDEKVICQLLIEEFVPANSQSQPALPDYRDAGSVDRSGKPEPPIDFPF